MKSAFKVLFTLCYHGNNVTMSCGTVHPELFAVAMCELILTPFPFPQKIEGRRCSECNVI